MKLIFVATVFLGITGILAKPALHDVDLGAANETTAVTSVTLTSSATEVTTNPTTNTTIITVEPITSNNMTTGTPASVEPITFTEQTGTTPVTPATLSTVPSNPSTPKTTNTSPKTTVKPPAKESGFDGASFGGGIGLGLGICLIFFVIWKIYVTKKSSRGYNTM